MADKQGRLAKLLEQEYKTKGVLCGFTTASGKRIKEIFDFRNRLFSGIGVGSIIGRKIFGKGYSATADSPEKRVSPLQMQQSAFSEKAVDVLLTLKRDTRISAKNSVVLPQMARDMNLTKQNIMKLVRLQGSTAEMKADMFFKRASDRETQYESQYKRTSGGISPTALGGSKKEGGGGGVYSFSMIQYFLRPTTRAPLFE
jgi:hypothetical protein